MGDELPSMCAGHGMPCPYETFRNSCFRELAEDIFHFIEEAGGAVGGFVFDFHGLAELFDKVKDIFG